MADLWCTVVWTCCGPPTWDGLEAQAEPPQTRAELPPLYLLSTVADGRRRVAVGGELDLATTPLLDAAVAEALRVGSAVPPAPSRFLLDLADVSFLDVSAVAALDRIEELVRRRGEKLSVVAPVAAGPRRLLLFAVVAEWLSPAFKPLYVADRVA